VFVVELVAAGLVVGLVFGTFGAGGSAVATPVLALLGVPGAVAVASPLPSMVPAALVGARAFWRSGNLDARTARRAIAGGVPGTILGALASAEIGGSRLLVLSGVLLLVTGARVSLPDPPGAGDAPRRAARGGDS
jgi:uncharacterized membrane protein YfcA